jgi:CubicO group peptidase (beta-lactamase class C family)
MSSKRNRASAPIGSLAPAVRSQSSILLTLVAILGLGACEVRSQEAPKSDCDVEPCTAGAGGGGGGGGGLGGVGGGGGGGGCAAEDSLPCFLDATVPSFVDAGGEAGKAIGLVVGVSYGGTRLVRGYGATVRGGDTPPDESTIFELASVTKVVTGYLAARGIENGELALEDPISTYFGADVPSYPGIPIRLHHLASHRSGLPSYPDNLVGAPPTPAAGYTRALLEEFLAAYTLPRAPGAEYEYSNLGSGMLGQACVDAAGLASYEALVQREVAVPMGLDDFHVELNEEQRGRKIQGHSMGAPAPELVIGAPLQGGGALHATAVDVLTFVEAALDGSDPAWERVKSPLDGLPVAENAEIGLLLAIEHPANGPTTYSKNGGSPGFSSQIVFTTDPPVAVVLLSNTSNTKGLLALGKEIIAAAAEPGAGP